MTGDWLILYPDHKLNNERQRSVYSRIQDSIVGLSGLKLVTFSGDGTFRQSDSLQSAGKWGITADNIVFIENGGKGFENYSAKFTAYENNVLKLTESFRLKGEKITLVWHLKRVGKNTASGLFSKKANIWRVKPLKEESATALKERLSGMLEYYAGYYSLINKESTYFIPSRVLLPFKFYQHAVGLKPFDAETAFAGLFFDTLQAGTAYQYLDKAMDRLRDKFPTAGSNYVEEYAAYMKLMAGEVLKPD